MKKLIVYVLVLAICTVVTSCKKTPKFPENSTEVIKKAAAQYQTLYEATSASLNHKNMMPRTINKNESVRLVNPYDWTSGFYPGTLWYLNFLTNDIKWEERALTYSKKLDTIQYWKGNHDVGFIIECSYGNYLKKHSSAAFDSVIVNTAKSLSSRFKPKAGILQSWNSNKRWNCPVIIDNMMNLELLFHASKITGDLTYYNIAVSHAKQTMKNHYRQDNSSYHVLNYDVENGGVLGNNTHQGYSDDSAWARGQSWGLYGFVLCYRETKDKAFLEQAVKVANYIKNHPNLPKDKVPYWDYDAPKSENTPRDASAAAIAASALYDLSSFLGEKGNEYKVFADEIMTSLSTPKYFAEKGTNGGFILKHSVGSIPHGAEVDAPLNYADYYFLEAIYKRKNLK